MTTADTTLPRSVISCAGITPAELAAASRQVPLQPNCSNTLASLRAQGVPIHVISVNWSAQFVAEALQLPLRPSGVDGPPDAEGMAQGSTGGPGLDGELRSARCMRVARATQL